MAAEQNSYTSLPGNHSESDLLLSELQITPRLQPSFIFQVMGSDNFDCGAKVVLGVGVLVFGIGMSVVIADVVTQVSAKGIGAGVFAASLGAGMTLLGFFGGRAHDGAKMHNEELRTDPEAARLSYGSIGSEE